MDPVNEIVGKIVEGYKIIKFLGRGKFSTVYQAEKQADHKLVALKIIKIYDIMDRNTIDKCLQEVNLLQKVNHPNIVKYLDSFMNQNELYIAIEWADKGDVKRFIKKFKQEGDFLDERKVIEYTREITSALIHMHEKRVIHRDLKPANILIFSDCTFKLSDLGLGRFMRDETVKAFSKVGTPLYMAPEVINNIGYDFKSDNWSLGCVVYELITLKSPFQTEEQISVMDLFKKINAGNYPPIKNNKYQLSSQIVDALLKVNPDERIELGTVLNLCEDYLAKQEEKPKVDPFIVMDDIIEKLRLIDYETNFCAKYNKEVITKLYFACSIYGYNYNEAFPPTKKEDNMNNNINNSTSLSNLPSSYPVQFAYFYDLSNWLMLIYKQNVNIEILPEFNIKFKKYDKKKSHEQQMNDLISDLKSMDIKVVFNSKFKYGYGEGVCLVLTQLCDKYLMKQNFIFKKPKYKDNSQKIKKEIQMGYDDIVLEENIGTNIGFKSNTNYNFGNNFKASSNSSGGKARFFSGMSKKKFISAISSTDDTSVTTDFSNNNEEDKINPNTMILHTAIEQSDWNKEYNRVETVLVIPEVSEESESQSEGSSINALQQSQTLKNIKRISNMNYNFNHWLSYFDQLNELNKTIENELKKISNAEKRIVPTDSLKQIINKLTLTKKAIKHYENEITGIENNIQAMEQEKNSLTKKLSTISNKKSTIIDNINVDTVKQLKSTIEQLKQNIQRLDTEIQIMNTICFSNKKGGETFSNFAQKMTTVDYNDNAINNGNDNAFDEEEIV